MPDLSTADISRALRERLKEDGSWRVPNGRTARRSKTDSIRLVLTAHIFRQPKLLGGMLVLLLIGGALIVLLSSTSPPTLASQVLETPTQNPVSTAAMPELWLTPAATSDTPGLVDTPPTAATAAVERHPTPTPLPVPVIGVPVPLVRSAAVGAVTATTEHLGNLTVDAQLTRAIAFGVEQRLEISARSDYAPLVGAHVSFRISNSFGSSVLTAPDTDRSGRSGKAWPTYRSVGLNQVRVTISVADGRELSAQLAFLGASSDD
jgi:hypothetical protein